jgi:two-component system sensor histidine kinase UhpB
VKHAEIDHVNIKLRRDGDELVIEVKDGGRGFDAQKVATDESQRGRGLSMARQRLNLFGGHMEIESAPGAGTQIVITTPLPGLSERASGGRS